MLYWRLHYHLVWTTLERTPWLDEQMHLQVCRSVVARANRLGVIVHQIGGIEDHVHVVASVPPSLTVAACVGQLKGASSHTANEALGMASAFRWESGYGAVSLGERSLPNVIAYVGDQRRHHAGGALIAFYERTNVDAPPAMSTDPSKQQRPV